MYFIKNGLTEAQVRRVTPASCMAVDLDNKGLERWCAESDD